MKTYECTKKYSHIRGFAGHPDFGGNGTEIWLMRFDAERFRKGIQKGKENFPKFNTVILGLSVEAWYLDKETFLKNVDTAFSILKEEKISTVVRYFNACAGWPISGIITAEIARPDLYPVYQNYMSDVLKVLADKDILIHDIINEPLNNTYGNFAAQKKMYEFARVIRDEIKKVDDRPITIGSQGYFAEDDDFTRQGWMAEEGDGAVRNDIAFFLDLMDVISLHAYNVKNVSKEEYKAAITKKLDRLEELNKPVLVTECCWGTETEETRKPILESELSTYSELGMGFSAHILLTGKMPDSTPFDERNPIKSGLYMSFLDENYNIRKYHDIYNKY